MHKFPFHLTRFRFAAIAGVALLAFGGPTFLRVERAVAAVTSTTINFEDVVVPNDDYVDANIYTAQGVTIEGAFGIVRDAADLSDWGLDGTDGRQFLGQNDNQPVTITFATPINGFQIDCSASEGTSNGNGITVTGLSAADAVVDSMSATFPFVNTWTTFSIQGAGITSVTLAGTPDDAPPWGCDKMIMSTGFPDPTTTSTTTTSTTTTSTTAASGSIAPSFTG
jgi:hypothetical protein